MNAIADVRLPSVARPLTVGLLTVSIVARRRLRRFNIEVSMSHTFYKVWIHLVWSTKNFYPYFNEDLRREVFDHIYEKARIEGYHLEIVNGWSDHVHCLVSLEPRTAISELVNMLKGESSHWINSERLTRTRFAWQEGFGAFSVSESLVPTVREYIARQGEHHRKRSCGEEVDDLMRQHGVERA